MKLLTLLLVCITLGISNPAEAQIWKKLTKSAGKTAEKAILKKAEEKAAKTIKGNSEKKTKKQSKKDKNNSQEPIEEVYAEDTFGSVEMYSKFDFIPGEEILFYDNFERDNVGDFPSRWDGNGGGELVEINHQKWLKLSSKTIYMPLPLEQLPENFTIEFDVYPVNFKQSGGGPAVRFWFWIDDDKNYKAGRNWAGTSFTFWTAIDTRVQVKNNRNGKVEINNRIEYADLAQHFFHPAHVSVAVNKRRFRLWVNEKKVVDMPRLAPEANWATFKFNVDGYNDPFLVSNFKVAAGGVDFRTQLINDGKFFTNGIRFDSGSAVLKPESYGILKEIATVLKRDNFKIHIIGHTDSDGSEEINLQLSEQRAMAIKNSLVSQFNISETLLSTEGKGSLKPLADNTIPEGKAKNRRVEFVKM
ncbi:OmpA family protein [Aquimarina sp. AU474]|uniref:OmpA family protein n=1 Tax=Aquimarina sp. AU474 TaxID=2108529 RepID=UPI000D68A4F2|nr:OmpA family protein [Aquimarina sp. AU474]